MFSNNTSKLLIYRELCAINRENKYKLINVRKKELLLFRYIYKIFHSPVHIDPTEQITSKTNTTS